MDILLLAQQGIHRLLHIGIQVNRIDEVQLRMPGGKRCNSLADVLKALAETLPPVAGKQDIGPALFERSEFVGPSGARFSLSWQNCVWPGPPGIVLIGAAVPEIDMDIDRIARYVPKGACVAM